MIITSFLIPNRISFYGPLSIKEGLFDRLIKNTRPESYLDPLTGDRRTEELRYTWYTSAGETDPGLTFGDDARTELRLPSKSQDVEVIVAVRDGRGGLSVDRTTFRVE